MFIKDIPRLHTALAEWMSCMILLSLVPRRLKGWRFGLAAGGALIIMYVWLEATRPLTSVFWMLAMAVAVGLMFLMMLLLGRMNAVTTAYCTIRAFLLAEFAASLEWQLYSFFHHSVELSHWMMALLSIAVVYAAVFSVSYFIERRAARGLPPPEMTWRELLSAVAVGVSAFLISNLSFVWSDTPFSSSIRQEIYNIRTLVDLAGVVALYAYHVRLYDLNSRRELDAIKNILQNQYVQYRQSRESIDLINRKYHDLKHQIAVLRAEQDPKERAAFLDKMEEEIQHYEAQNKTGNSVLDTVLTGKSLYCAKHSIKLTAVADGEALHFMEVVDICTVFGNLLDNAIEYELTVPNKELRLIHLEVSTRRGFLLIRCENHFEGELVLHQGLPSTTKSDTNYHGYGLKSIRYTAQKYGGSMTVSKEDTWFVVTLLIPLPPA